ncbi:hypothetical protein M2266_004194 [Streptomyces sp. SPB162]|nr:hypothetical protein [Streptomyces sp. SPB162]
MRTITASTSVATEKPSADHLARLRFAAGTAAVAIAPTAGRAAVTVRRGKDMSYQTALIRRVAATRTAVPPSIDTAYERT